MITDETLAAIEALVPLAPLASAAKRPPDPGGPAPAAGSAAGRLLRHGVPPQPERPRAPLRPAPRAVRRGREALRLPRPVVQVHRGATRAGRARDRGGTGRRRPSRQRREPLRARGGRQPRHQHELLDARRHPDGDALRRARSRRADPSRQDARHDDRGRGGHALPHGRACSGSRASAPTPGSFSPAPSPRPGRRSTCSPSASPARSRRPPTRWAASTASSSRPGIGEHQPEIRAAICARLAWLGVAIDPEANARHATRIDAAGSRIAVLVVPTDEEQVIAEEAVSVLQAEGRDA